MFLFSKTLEEETKQTNGQEVKTPHPYDILLRFFGFINYWYFYKYRGSLDSCKIDNNNQTLLDLRKRSVNKQNKLQDAGAEDNANESDFTTATEKTLKTDDETTLRGTKF